MGKSFDPYKGYEIYMAGGLFDIGSRMRNLALAKRLRDGLKSAKIILPQIEAKEFFTKDGTFNMVECSKKCAERAVFSDVVLVNLDGPDADSGTALEAGLALYQKIVGATTSKQPPIVICYRTDFRTDMSRELGINGMFNLADKIIYKPAFASTDKEMEKFLDDLAKEIIASITEIIKSR